MAFTADILYENMNKTRKVRNNIVNTALFTLDIDLLWVLCYALTIKTGKSRSDRGDIIWQLP